MVSPSHPLPTILVYAFEGLIPGQLAKTGVRRNDMILPENFDHVWLGSKEANVLKNLGKNPGRLEADVEDGQPVNTEYIPPDGE